MSKPAETSRDPRVLFANIPRPAPVLDLDLITKQDIENRLKDLKDLRISFEPPKKKLTKRQQKQQRYTLTNNQLRTELLDARIAKLEMFLEQLQEDEEKKYESPPRKTPVQKKPMSKPRKERASSPEKVSLKEADLLPYTRVKEFINMVVEKTGYDFPNGAKVSRGFVVALNMRFYEWIESVMSVLLLLHNPSATAKKTITTEEVQAAIEAQNPGLTRNLDERVQALEKRQKKTRFVVRARVQQSMKSFLHGKRIQVAAVDLVRDALLLRSFEVLSLMTKFLAEKNRVIFKVCPPFSSSKTRKSRGKIESMNPLMDLDDWDSEEDGEITKSSSEDDLHEEDEVEEEMEWAANNDNMSAEIIDFDESDTEGEENEGDGTEGSSSGDDIAGDMEEMNIHTTPEETWM